MIGEDPVGLASVVDDCDDVVVDSVRRAGVSGLRLRHGVPPPINRSTRRSITMPRTMRAIRLTGPAPD